MQRWIKTGGLLGTVVLLVAASMGCETSSHKTVRMYESTHHVQPASDEEATREEEPDSEYQMQSPGRMVPPGEMQSPGQMVPPPR